jgi:hypothetical protein
MQRRGYIIIVIDKRPPFYRALSPKMKKRSREDGARTIQGEVAASHARKARTAAMRSSG